MAKILVYHPWIYLKGGAERVLLELYKNSTHDIDICTSYFDKTSTFDEFNDINVTIVKGWCPVSVKRNFMNILKSFVSICTARIENVEQYDAILISSEGLGDFFSLIGNGKKRIGAYVHTPLKIIYDKKTSFSLKNKLSPCTYLTYLIIKPIYHFFNKIIWRRYNFLIANSMEVKRRVRDSNLSQLEHISIVNPGASVKKIPIANKSKILPAKRYFLVIGRVMWQKDVEIAISAFKKAQIIDFDLVIAGCVDEKSIPYAAKLKKMCTHNIRIVENPDDDYYERLFQECYSVVFSPRCEDWGIIPVEAMLRGKPVIATRAGGPLESVLDEKTGFLVNHSADDFARAIKKIAEMDNGEYQQISRASIKRGREFTWEKFGQRIDTVIEKNTIKSVLSIENLIQKQKSVQIQ